jgi:hypothetical protein
MKRSSPTERYKAAGCAAGIQIIGLLFVIVGEMLKVQQRPGFASVTRQSAELSSLQP